MNFFFSWFTETVCLDTNHNNIFVKQLSMVLGVALLMLGVGLVPGEINHGIQGPSTIGKCSQPPVWKDTRLSCGLAFFIPNPG